LTVNTNGPRHDKSRNFREGSEAFARSGTEVDVSHAYRRRRRLRIPRHWRREMRRRVSERGSIMAKKKTPDVDPAIVLVEKTLVESLTPKVQAKLEHYQQITAPMRAFVVTNEASCNVADELLLRVLQEKDGLEAVRVSGPGALGVLARKLNAIFKPPADVLDQTAAYLKKQIGEYKVAQRAMQAVNYQAAAQAHIVGDHTSASNKLAAAAAAETETARGTSVGEKWT